MNLKKFVSFLNFCGWNLVDWFWNNIFWLNKKLIKSHTYDNFGNIGKHPALNRRLELIAYFLIYLMTSVVQSFVLTQHFSKSQPNFYKESFLNDVEIFKWIYIVLRCRDKPFGQPQILVSFAFLMLKLR